MTTTSITKHAVELRAREPAVQLLNKKALAQKLGQDDAPGNCDFGVADIQNQESILDAAAGEAGQNGREALTADVVPRQIQCLQWHRLLRLRHPNALLDGNFLQFLQFLEVGSCAVRIRRGRPRLRANVKHWVWAVGNTFHDLFLPGKEQA
jgi:hypothetical protein